MIKSDWNVFKSKFSGNPQFNFEWMCYLLFCNEHGKNTGIFRYKNQSAIETNPITINGKVIGWQAKFYDTALSAHKADILEMLGKAKRDYPNINKIIFYTNSEWGQNKGKEPAGKIEIDNKAKELSIDLEWRCGSYFDSAFVVDNNKRVVSHFFRESDGVYELLESLSFHTETVLCDIESEIDFNGQKVVIDRSEILSKIEGTTKQAIILSGEGGTGKTALIKSLYKDKHPDSAFYVHKATEFSVNKVDEFLSGVSLNDFIKAHQGVCTKIVVIDSAENLLSLENNNPFREYVSALLKAGWKIWLTTRNNYLDNLTFQFIEVYKIAYQSINLSGLTPDQLGNLSKNYNFQLPQDQRLKDLITLPFYLREYLKHHQESKSLNYTEFRNSLWPRVITKGSPQRERTFIDMAITKADSGRFFVQLDSGTNNQQVENNLSDDGIISYESPHGYFITHDIYEEWALEKHLESIFLVTENASSFFTEIKQSLSIRRVFRKWFSEKLEDKDQEIIAFIQGSLNSDEIPKLWIDEVLISILLSDYSEFFFSSYKNRLLNDDWSLLKQICLLIRLGCKEVDNTFFEKIGVFNTDFLSMKYVLTKPKGNGWRSLIKFIYENNPSFGEDKFRFILPVIHDWNNSIKTGETTRHSSLMALKYYEWTITENTYITNDDASKNLILTILYGVQEISTELSQLIDQIIENKWKKHNDPYNLLSQYILSKLECFGVANTLPGKVIGLAKLFWIYEPPKKDIYYGPPPTGVDHYFGVEHDSQNYYPPSAYQTPIYCLLQADLKLTLDFVIEFTNVATEKYATSSLDQNGVETVTVVLKNGSSIKQYINNRLWCLYRGTQVNSDILESIHMSLERFLLEQGKHYSSENLETILYYILSRTNSAALSSLVSSIVVAFPEKTFQVAKILFRTKEFFIYDTLRHMLDQTHKTQLTMLKNNFDINCMNELHKNERISACDEKHRKLTLEHIMLQYQFFRSGETSEAEADERLEEISKILDAHYDELPEKENETHADKTWRLYLARMDRRKMLPITTETKDGVMIEFNPEIDSELKEYSENALKESNEPYKHTQLLLWSENRLYRRDDYKKYINYESDPLCALEEAKVLWSEIISGGDSASAYFNRSLPSVVCAVLFRDFCEMMDRADLEFCKEVVFCYGSLFLKKGYFYQISDGVLPALLVLPLLLEHFPEEEGNIKHLMIYALMREDSIDMGMTKFNSLQALWRKDFDFALSIYIGYLVLGQKQKDMLSEYRKTAYENGQYDIDIEDFWNIFSESCSDIFEQILDESINKHVIEDIHKFDVDILSTAFRIAPLKTECNDAIPYIKDIITIISAKILSNDRNEKIDYTTRHIFIEKYTQYVLHLDLEDINDYLCPFINNFSVGKGISELIEEFINSEDYANRPDHFWRVWELLKDKVIETSIKGPRQDYSNQIIESYMFARNFWKEDAKEWHTFSKERTPFFNELTSRLSGDSSYLYSLSKLLCGLGSIYLEDGILWLSSAIKNNEISLSRDRQDDTIYYLEKVARKYIFINREKVRRNAKIRSAIISILDLLIKNESIVGYLLREDVA